MEGHLLMSKKEVSRRGAFEMVSQGKWTVAEAARRLKLSYRQCHRSYSRFLSEGDPGLLHRSRGRRSNRATDPRLRQAVLQRYEDVYEDFGPTFAAEKLAEDGYEVDHETLRRWLVAEGKWKMHRKRSEYRSRRERREHFGELVQMDGSHHNWFGPDRPKTCVIQMIDDCTSERLSLMAPEETTEACMLALWQWIEHHGIPTSLYTDRKNVYVTNRPATIEEQFAGQEPLTAFGKACAKLGIEIIPANSPQAKGRVERAHGVNQDRLVKELRLQGIKTIEGANEFLGSGFTDHLNRKFAFKPRSKDDHHRPVPRGLNLVHVFCWEEVRVVANDWTIRYENKVLQILKGNGTLPGPGRRVTVQKLLDGTLRIVYEGRALQHRELPLEERRAVEQSPVAAKATVRVGHIPAENHPWRRMSLSARSSRV